MCTRTNYVNFKLTEHVEAQLLPSECTNAAGTAKSLVSTFVAIVTTQIVPFLGLHPHVAPMNKFPDLIIFTALSGSINSCLTASLIDDVIPYFG